MNTRTLTLTIIALVSASLIGYAFVERTDRMTTERTLNLSEYGVALTVPGRLNDVTSRTVDRTNNGPGLVLRMYVEETCEIGSFYKIQKNQIANAAPWTEDTLEQFQVPIGSNPARVKEFTDFYLVFEPSQEPCSNDPADAERTAQKRMDLWNSLVSARYMNT